MAIRALPIKLQSTHGTVGIITLRNRIFIDCVREVAKPLTTGKIRFGATLVGSKM
jgi:hypothetical protein